MRFSRRRSHHNHFAAARYLRRDSIHQHRAGIGRPSAGDINAHSAKTANDLPHGSALHGAFPPAGLTQKFRLIGADILGTAPKSPKELRRDPLCRRLQFRFGNLIGFRAVEFQRIFLHRFIAPLADGLHDLSGGLLNARAGFRGPFPHGGNLLLFRRSVCFYNGNHPELRPRFCQ